MCVALAAVALTPYLELRPAFLSYLLLALTLWFLERPAQTLRSYVPLLVLFALWATLDEWFLLGPLAVGLYALGEAMQPGARAGGELEEGGGVSPAALGLVAAAGLAVCLLNPHHVRAFMLPAALGPSADLGDGALGASGSPFAPAYFASDLGRSPAGIAYFALAALGLLSFAANASGWRWSRAILWAVFFLLSAYRAEAVPFFAVVGGAVAALNFREFAERRWGVGSRKHASNGQAVALVALLALVVVAWPDWLRPGPAGPRQWAIEADAGLVDAARQFEQWRAYGQLPADARGFNLSLAAAHHFAWFAPAEKSFADGRAHLFPGPVLENFRDVRQALVQPAPDRGGASQADWRAVLRKAKVTHLTVHDPANPRLVAALRHLFAVPGEWALVHLHGRASVFAWRDAGQTEGAAAKLPALDVASWGFRPRPGQKAPAGGPSRDPRLRAWWEAFWEPPAEPDPHRDEALACLAHFDARRPAYAERRRAAWEASLAAGAVGVQVSGSLPCALAGTYLRQDLLRVSRQPLPMGAPGQQSPLDRLGYTWMGAYRRHSDDGPPGSALAAVRAARIALAANPDDAVTYLLLGEGYVRLLHETRERVGPVDLAAVRRVQAITAFKRAAQPRPDLPAAHQALAELYEGMGYLDLALGHLEGLLASTRAAGRRPAEAPEEFARRLKALEGTVAALGKKVRDQLNLFETQSFGQGALGRARAAQAAGLPGKALEALLGSSYAAFGREGALLQLQLFLHAGRVKEVREWMTPEQEPILEPANYRWIQALLAAAVGDYRQADGDLAVLTNGMIELPDLGLKNVRRKAVPALLVGEFLLDNAARRPLPLRRGGPEALQAHLEGRVLDVRQEASLLVLRGVLALEQGETEAAAGLLRQAVGLWSVRGDGMTELAHHYLALLASPGRQAFKSAR